MEPIAENRETGVTIFLTGEERGDMILPDVVVFMDDTKVYEECSVSRYDCESTVQKIYNGYLYTEQIVNSAIDRDIKREADELTDYYNQMEIDDRETLLTDAAYSFLCEILDDPIEKIVGKIESEEIIEDFKDHALEYLARKWELPIYRPMILEDDNGEDFYEEYPYEVMEFDDPDNPMYK